MELTQKQKDALNRAVAELCGWTKIDAPNGFQVGYKPNVAPQGKWQIPNYCDDRNALPELWEAVEKQEGAGCLTCEMYSLLGINPADTIGCKTLKRFAYAGPAVHVIAALKACGKWTPELEAIMQEEKP